MSFHDTCITVRFNEVDSYRIAWHGHYVAWMEVGRNELAARFGLAVDQLADAGYLAPVVAMEVKYLRPAHYNEKLTIRTTARRNETPTLEFRGLVLDVDGRTVARGVTVHALTDLNGITQYRLPEVIAPRLAQMLDWAEAT